MDLEQTKLRDDGGIISDVDKCTHYMLQIWDWNIFTQEMMTEWSQKAPIDKTYGNAVTFFNGKMKGIDLYETASGNTLGENGFIQANAVSCIVEQVVGKLQDYKENFVKEFGKKDTAITMAVSEFKGGSSKLRSEMNDKKSSLASIAASLAALTK